MDKILFFAVQCLFRLLKLLPPRLAGAMGAGMGRLFYALDRKHRLITIRNLSRVYPEKESGWKKHTAREAFAEMGRTMFELPHVFMQPQEFLQSRVEIRGEEHFHQAMKQGRGALLATAHYCNWELLGLIVNLMEYETHTLYRPMRQPLIDAYIKKYRERFGAHLQPRSAGLRWMPKALKNNSCIIIGIDQHVSAAGINVPFLGHMTSTSALPAVFCRKWDVPMLGVGIKRIGRGFHFILEFWPIDLPDVVEERERDHCQVMQSVNSSFDRLIHERPELWLWLHRRWRILDDNEKESS